MIVLLNNPPASTPSLCAENPAVLLHHDVPSLVCAHLDDDAVVETDVTTKSKLPPCNLVDAVQLVAKVLFDPNFKTCKADSGVSIGMTGVPGADVLEKVKKSEGCQRVFTSVKDLLKNNPKAKCTVQGTPLVEFAGKTIVDFVENLNQLKAGLPA
ncbi:hypothetical protein H310_09897 [Aphanomyces invadans]|uniref:Elicitin n=1 Tax=Aphanomyces invadans TaxID=157072 RepID=A0A024TSE0_9STRA|nr:hypothetical protein H310_09897 [Aphanomyces invadans]ETV97075.1 hypothetical protein H310_09897 [Aphanomyces invadans]|eukprot:XP_008874321.1 hypothetical protein H310_09897 [Aphanomyces invadans]